MSKHKTTKINSNFKQKYWKDYVNITTKQTSIWEGENNFFKWPYRSNRAWGFQGFFVFKKFTDKRLLFETIFFDSEFEMDEDLKL